VYFADPPYGLQQGDADPLKELAFSGVYRAVNGKVELLNKELPRPNGLGFSPDEKFLHVSNSQTARKIWMRYGVKADGTLDEGKVFLDVTTERAPGAPDGLKLDNAGNLHGTGPGGIWIISPEAKPLGRIELPEVPANMAWGDADGKTLYITARTSVHRVRMKASGQRPCC
jgi:gluconolactonase